MGDVTFTVRVDDELKTAFAEAAKAQDRTGGQLVRDFMRDYVQRTRENVEYEAWFRREVEAGRADLRAGRFRPSEEVEAHFAARRAGLLKKSRP
jgi:predicted transcriptional regulator